MENEIGDEKKEEDGEKGKNGIVVLALRVEDGGLGLSLIHISEPTRPY